METKSVKMETKPVRLETKLVKLETTYNFQEVEEFKKKFKLSIDNQWVYKIRGVLNIYSLFKNKNFP